MLAVLAAVDAVFEATAPLVRAVIAEVLLATAPSDSALTALAISVSAWVLL